MRRSFRNLTVLSVVLAFCISIFGLTVPTAAMAEVRAALISDQKRGDKGPIDLFYEGLVRGEEELGMEAKFFEIQHAGEFEAQIRAMAEDEYNLIFVTFDTMADAATNVAKDFPDTKFVILDGTATVELPNMMSTLFKEHDAAFLAGIVAGKMTRTNKIGFIGGADIDIINRYKAGLFQGVRYVNPKAKIEVTYTNNFEDPAKGKELALMLNSKGADVLLSCAAKSTLGVYDAIKTTNQFIIGAEIDAAKVDPKRGLTSVREAFDLLVFNVMKDVKENRFKSGLHVYGMDIGMVDITPINTRLVSWDVIKQVDKLRMQIIEGDLKVKGQEMFYSGTLR